jgi:hypothetical protein
MMVVSRCGDEQRKLQVRPAQPTQFGLGTLIAMMRKTLTSARVGCSLNPN